MVMFVWRNWMNEWWLDEQTNWENLTCLQVFIRLHSPSPKSLHSVERYSTNIMTCNALICGSRQYKDTSKSVKASVYISSLSCPFAGFLLLLHFHNLPLLQSCLSHQLWSLSKVQKEPNCHQWEEGKRQMLCVRFIFFYPPLLLLALSLSVNCGTLASFQHCLSGTAGFN